MEDIGRAFEWVGIGVIVAGALITLVVAANTLRATGGEAAYVAARRTFGRALLLGLEVLVAADLIETVSVKLTLESIGALGLLVIVRTVLSFSIDIEINGALPWRAGAPGD